MKLRGQFTLREVAGEVLVVPMGDTALSLNGMIILNGVSKVIWEALEPGATQEELLQRILDEFDVSQKTAEEDLASFLEDLRKQNLIEE